MAVFGSLRVTTAALLFLGIFALYSAGSDPVVYLPFAILDVSLAYGVHIKHKTAIKIALVYLALDFFLALLGLISGDVLMGVVAALDFMAIHDIVSYIEELFHGKDANG